MPTKKAEKIKDFREHIEKTYQNGGLDGCGGSLGELICYEIHDQPVNPRMEWKTMNDGYSTGLTFRELAEK